MLNNNLKNLKIFLIKLSLLTFFLYLTFFSISNSHPYFFCLSLIIFLKVLFFDIKKISNFFLSSVSILLCLMLCEYLAGFFLKKEINHSYYDKSISSLFTKKNKNIGYKLSNGEHSFKFYLKENKMEKKLFEIDYFIERNMRVKNRFLKEDKCPKFILMGGSHNFGQALKFDDTLQGILEKNGNSMNLSVPGYGLSHSFWRLKSEESLLKKLCNKNSEKIIIYRYMFMNGHILRNVGLHSYNFNGPDLRKHRIKQKFDDMIIHRYCSNFYSCLTYNLNYFFYRILSTFRHSNTFLAKPIGKKLEQILYFNEKNFQHSVNLVNYLSDYIKYNYPNDKLIIYVENIGYKKNKDPYNFFKKNQVEDNYANMHYTKLKKNKNIILLKTSRLSNIQECDQLYISYEGHPNECHNKKLGNEILELLNVKN